MASKLKTKLKSFHDMTDEERTEYVKKFDKPLVFEETTPLTPEMKAAWEAAKRGPGRPRIGKGSKKISVSVERSLLAKSDKLAKKLKMTRAKLIATGLELATAQLGSRSNIPVRKRSQRAATSTKRRRLA